MMDYGSPADALAAQVLAHARQVRVNCPNVKTVSGAEGTAALLLNTAGAVREAEAMLRAAVALERERGMSWADVGSYLGMSKQAAWQRFGAPASK